MSIFSDYVRQLGMNVLSVLISDQDFFFNFSSKLYMGFGNIVAASSVHACV